MGTRRSRGAAVVRGLICIAVLGLTFSASAAAAVPVTVSPADGTPDASPQTQISILGPAPRTIRSVHVTGSVSGSHPGRLAPYSRGRGASFILARPLTQAEHVSVLLRISGRTPIKTSFTVARLGTIQPILNIPILQPTKLDHFVSEPTLLPPRITVHRGFGRPGGDLFLAPLPSPEIHPESNNVLTIHPVGPGGPMIVDSRGRLVWFEQLPPPLVAANFRPQRYAGHEVLTWWQGGVTPAAFGLGEGVIADTSYRTMKVVKTGNGYSADIHEFLLTPDGDALFTVYSPILVHLPGTPAGTRSPLLDSIAQEVDIRTGLVVWEWHANGHVPLKDSYATRATSSTFDAYHLNSIQPLPGNHVLLSARDTSAVYDVDRATGRIVWTLGGKASSLRLGPGARFFFQHDAQLHADSTVTLFDDEAGPPIKAKSSRGIVLALDLKRKTARLVRQFRRPVDTLAESEGNVQTLPSGNRFVGWGSAPEFSEFTATGAMVFDASLPVDDGSYRVYRFPWSARPTTRPVVAVRRDTGRQLSVYVSWNGATTVSEWQVLAGTSAASLSSVAVARPSGFETRIAIDTAASTFVVQALDEQGKVLSTSRPVGAS